MTIALFHNSITLQLSRQKLFTVNNITVYYRLAYTEDCRSMSTFNVTHSFYFGGVRCVLLSFRHTKDSTDIIM